jgi:hypothetical protein
MVTPRFGHRERRWRVFLQARPTVHCALDAPPTERGWQKDSRNRRSDRHSGGSEPVHAMSCGRVLAPPESAPDRPVDGAANTTETELSLVVIPPGKESTVYLSDVVVPNGEDRRAINRQTAPRGATRVAKSRLLHFRFSSFLLKPLVSRMNRRRCILTVRSARLICEQKRSPIVRWKNGTHTKGGEAW